MQSPLRPPASGIVAAYAKYRWMDGHPPVLATLNKRSTTLAISLPDADGVANANANTKKLLTRNAGQEEVNILVGPRRVQHTKF